MEGIEQSGSTFDQEGFKNEASWFHGSTTKNCYVIDRFLWSVEDELRLEQHGRLLRAYCKDFGELQELGHEACDAHVKASPHCTGGRVARHYITNSLPIEQSMLIFSSLLPNAGVKLKGKRVVDVGSRLGNNLVVGTLFSDAAELVGVEVDPFFAKESSDMLVRCAGSLFPGEKVCNVRVVCEDIAKCPALLESADVVIFFNPFEQRYTSPEAKNLLMLFASQVTKKGTIVVTVPSVDAIYERAGCALDLVTGKNKDCVDLGLWLRPLKDAEDIFVYEVLANGVR